ncbi:hypothetical protein J7J95_02365 [bacterium]|nr:hypothetical protein [bacterium]
MKKVWVLFFLLTGGIGVAFLLRSKSSPLPSPVTTREEKKFLVSRELFNQGIVKFSGPYWNEKKQAIEIFLSGTEVLFSPQRDFAEQVASLQLILKKYRIVDKNGKKPKVVDLRTLNPYVSF